MGPPRETSALLRTLYDVRSKVVHEGLSLAEMAQHRKYRRFFSKTDYTLLIAAAQSLVREVLQAFLVAMASGMSVNAVLHQLEENLLQRLEWSPPTSDVGKESM